MVKSPIATLLAATVFQFYVSIVDPSILAQPLAPADPSIAPTAVTTVAAPATSGNTTQTQNGSGQSDRYRRGSAARRDTAHVALSV